MGTHDPRVDAYIDRAAPFAKPILRHLREVVHSAAPDIEETLKWGIPHFMRDDTRERRLATALEWIAAGKTRHWKYQKC